MRGHEGLLGGVVGGREERGAEEAAGGIDKNFYIIECLRLGRRWGTDKTANWLWAFDCRSSGTSNI